MGRKRSVAKDDGSLFDTNDDVQITSYTLLAIDQFVVPSKWCPNGHIIEWHNEETNVSVVIVRRVNTDTMTTEPVCVVCGLTEAGKPDDAPTSEGSTDN